MIQTLCFTVVYHYIYSLNSFLLYDIYIYICSPPPPPRSTFCILLSAQSSTRKLFAQFKRKTKKNKKQETTKKKQKKQNPEGTLRKLWLRHFPQGFFFFCFFFFFFLFVRFTVASGIFLTKTLSITGLWYSLFP